MMYIKKQIEEAVDAVGETLPQRIRTSSSLLALPLASYVILGSHFTSLARYVPTVHEDPRE